MPFDLNPRSRKNLEGVHLDLGAVVYRAAEMAEVDDFTFVVTEGVRSIDRQREMVAKGLSRTTNSRHLHGCAVDLMVMLGGHRPTWEVPAYHCLSDLVKSAAESVGVPIEWGGDWKSFFDGPHFQLPRDRYPDCQPIPPEVGSSSAVVPGQRGGAVRCLQTNLNAAFPHLKPSLDIDGDYGTRTRRRVVAVQGIILSPDKGGIWGVGSQDSFREYCRAHGISL